MNMILAPMQWADVKDIDDTEPVGEHDIECLLEIREVLRKHGKQNRLGVALLHSHFNISDDEAFVEEADEADRTLVLRPMKREKAVRGNVGTIFHLRDGDFETMAWCRQYCERGNLFNMGKHVKRHRSED